MTINADGYIKQVCNGSNRTALKQFLKELRTNKHSEQTLRTKFQFIRDLANRFPNKKFKQISRKDIGDFLDERGKVVKPNSITLIKTHIKHFYRWHEGEGEETPKKVRWLHCGATNKEEMTFEDMFNEKEIMAMVKVSNIRDRCIIVTLFDSGMRSGELRALRIKNVKFTNGAAILSIPKDISKTFARDVPVVRAVPYLKEYITQHRDSDNGKAYLFLTVKGGELGEHGIINILRNARDKARITKHINPHLLRHSRATEIKVRKSMIEDEMRAFFGWRDNSNMPSYYGRIAKQHVVDAVRKEAGLEVVEEPRDLMRPVSCPKCGINNAPTNKFCYDCSEPLSQEFTLASKDDMIAQKESQIMDQNKKIDELTNDIYKLAMGFKQLAQFFDIMKRDFDDKEDLSADEVDKKLAEIVNYFNSKDSLLQGNY